MKVRPEPLAQQRGRWAEDLAERHLSDAGLETITKNYRCKHGEIDLVMRDGDDTVFVEVRYRKRRDFGSGADSVDGRKQNRVVSTAQHYLQRHPSACDGPCRFDVVSVGGGNGNENQLEWIRNAFGA